MFKNIVTFVLAVMIFTVASNVSVFANSGAANETRTAAGQESKKETGDLKTLVKRQEKSGGLNVSDKSTLAEYQKAKQQGKGFSTTTKVLIGVGVAVAVIAIVVVAARNDVRNSVFR